MKIKKKSIIIPAFALLIGASLAGSISGTVAWYQYSTRVNAAYVGMSGGKDGNLQMRFDSNEEWSSRITFDQTETYLGDIGSKMAPVTPGAELETDSDLPATFKKAPVFGKGAYSSWVNADEKDYIVFPLQLQFIEHEGDQKVPADGKNIYLSELYIEPHLNEQDDITEAIRVHIANETDDTNFLISKSGGSTAIGGNLDLDGDDQPDQAYPENDKYGFKGGALADVMYGIDGGTQESLAVNDVCATLNEDGTFDANDASYELIGTTNGGVLDLTITIWVEGWQQLGTNDFWSKDYIDSYFDIGFEFAVNPAE